MKNTEKFLSESCSWNDFYNDRDCIEAKYKVITFEQIENILSSASVKELYTRMSQKIMSDLTLAIFEPKNIRPPFSTDDIQRWMIQNTSHFFRQSSLSSLFCFRGCNDYLMTSIHKNSNKRDATYATVLFTTLKKKDAIYYAWKNMGNVYVFDCLKLAKIMIPMGDGNDINYKIIAENIKRWESEGIKNINIHETDNVEERMQDLKKECNFYRSCVEMYQRNYGIMENFMYIPHFLSNLKKNVLTWVDVRKEGNNYIPKLLETSVVQKQDYRPLLLDYINELSHKEDNKKRCHYRRHFITIIVLAIISLFVIIFTIIILSKQTKKLNLLLDTIWKNGTIKKSTFP